MYQSKRFHRFLFFLDPGKIFIDGRFGPLCLGRNVRMIFCQLFGQMVEGPAFAPNLRDAQRPEVLGLFRQILFPLGEDIGDDAELLLIFQHLLLPQRKLMLPEVERVENLRPFAQRNVVLGCGNGDIEIGHP